MIVGEPMPDNTAQLPPDAHPEEFWCAWEFTLED